MASSLAEEEARKQTAVPLAEQTEEELRKRFSRSILLPQVRFIESSSHHQNPDDVIQSALV